LFSGVLSLKKRSGQLESNNLFVWQLQISDRDITGVQAVNFCPQIFPSKTDFQPLFCIFGRNFPTRRTSSDSL